MMKIVIKITTISNDSNS